MTMRRASDGTRNSRRRCETVSIEDALRRWLKRSKARHRTSKEAIYARWSEIVGEELAARTRPVDVRSGELIVEVDSAPLLNELSTYCKEEILGSLHALEEFRAIHAIRFRAGAF